MNHMPERTGPIYFITRGPIHVAESSHIADMPRKMPIMLDSTPMARRKVVIWPPKERTVKYRRASEKDGKKAGCQKYVCSVRRAFLNCVLTDVVFVATVAGSVDFDSLSSGTMLYTRAIVKYSTAIEPAVIEPVMMIARLVETPSMKATSRGATSLQKRSMRLICEFIAVIRVSSHGLHLFVALCELTS